MLSDEQTRLACEHRGKGSHRWLCEPWYEPEMRVPFFAEQITLKTASGVCLALHAANGDQL